MKTLWLKKDGADDLVLFFNGWGMDGRIASYLLEESAGGVPGDFMACYDYRTLLFEPGFALLTEEYRSITVVAWSLGVWVARQVGLEKVRKAIAINGTINPVSDAEGIPPGAFHATLSSWSDENRHRFNRRMCGSDEVFDFFASISSGRETAEQLEELVRIGDVLQAAGNGPGCSWQYSHAIIGGRDLIFPALQQFNAWKGVPQTIISDMPHFPFFHFRNLQEVLACME
jgi:pimeloyl-[acyl-carrier protein] methyl ester esterase